MIRASGILYVSSKGTGLFLKRGPGGDCPGMWCFPGGTYEPDIDKDIEACARREAKEEIGNPPKGDITYLARRIANREVAGQTGQVINPPVPDVINSAANNTPPSDAIVVPGEQVDFTTFVQRIDEEFVPTLNGEHVGYAWAPLDQPPEPLHPGCRVALQRLATTDELAVARMIAAGDLTSPQKYANMWLFAMRITGTGVAYRTKYDEFVARDPKLYMNEEFLARCNGLPVIVDHPEGAVLTSEEYGSRTVGGIMLPYLKPEIEEVWGIARIYDEATALLMEKDQQMSTSPSVVFHDPSVNRKLKDEEGNLILLEGKPSLIDHLAICGQGVWDKGGSPSGVQSAAIGDSEMTEEEKAAAAKARADSETRADASDKKLDALLAGLSPLMALPDAIKALTSRMDSMDAKIGDSKKDADEEDKKDDKAEEEDKKDDAALDKCLTKQDEDKKDDEDEVLDDEDKKDDATDEPGEKKDKPKEVVADKKDDSVSHEPSISARIRRVESLIRPMTDEDHRALADAQERYDHVFLAFGDSAPRPMAGETVMDYRLRAASKLQSHSPAWKSTKLSVLARADSEAFGQVEKAILADAVRAAERPVDLKPGQMRAITRPDGTGRSITTFAGNGSFVRQFKPRTRRVTTINTKFA